MPSTYSDSLRLELIADGEQTGTWGQTTNRNLGILLEESVTGVAHIGLAGASDLTLTALDGAADQSRKMVLSFTGGNSQARSIICPAVNKVYIVNNQSSDTLTLKKAAGIVNVTIPAGGSSTVYSVAGDFYLVGVSGSFSNLGGVVTASAAELNVLDGITASTSELNLLDGVTATTPELNILDGVTATAAELNILDGVTATAAELNILDGVTATAADLNKTITLPTLASGTWTPTVTNNTNSQSPSGGVCWYSRVGSIVTVSGTVSFAGVNIGVPVIVSVSLPIASDFTTTGDASGTAVVDTASLAANVTAAVSANTMLIYTEAIPSTSIRQWRFIAQYVLR